MAFTAASSQEWAFELWHEGKLVMEAGDTLRGQIKYDLQQDLLQYKNSQSIAEAFTARKVIYFEIFDNTVKRYRQFYSLPYAALTNYKAPVFFELLQEGKLTILCREALEYKTVSSPYMVGSYTRLVLVNHFYVLEENGDIVELDGKKSDLLERMGRKSKEVEDFVKKNRLRYDEKYDIARMVQYYNAL
jgi:hypothetical protein